MTTRSTEPSSWREVQESWREVQKAKAPLLACWRTVQHSTIFPVLRRMYEAYKRRYEGQEWEWVEEEAAVRIRLLNRAWDKPSVYHYYELGLGATERGVVLWCKLDLSSELRANLEPSGRQIWPEDIAKFNFETAVDVTALTEDDFARCFQYIIAGRGTSTRIPKIDGVRPFGEKVVTEADRSFNAAREVVYNSKSRQQADTLRKKLGFPFCRVYPGEKGKSGVLIADAMEKLGSAQRLLDEDHSLEAISVAQEATRLAAKAQKTAEHEYERVYANGVSSGAGSIINAAGLSMINALNGAIVGAILLARAGIIGAILGFMTGAMVISSPVEFRRVVFFVRARSKLINKLKALVRKIKLTIDLYHPEASVFYGAIGALAGVVSGFFLGFWVGVFTGGSIGPAALLSMRIGASLGWLIGALMNRWFIGVMKDSWRIGRDYRPSEDIDS